MIDGDVGPAQTGFVLDLDMDRIRLNPQQPRKYFDEDKLDELAESIIEHGVLEPVIVRPVGPGVYELVAGERRFRASVRAGLRSIPAVLRELDDRQTLEISLIENIQREDIKPVECAIAYRRLMDEFDMTQERVADRVGKSRSAIANTLRLLSLPSQILESLDKGQITEGHARALLSVSDKESMLQIWDRIVKQGLSVREAERMSRSPRPVPKADQPVVSRATSGQGGDDPNLMDMEDRLRRFLGTKVGIHRQQNGQGKIEIEFYDEEDLGRILDLMANI